MKEKDNDVVVEREEKKSSPNDLQEGKSKIGKFRLGERVKIKLDIKTDFQPVGHITRATIRLGKYWYEVKFDKPLLKKKHSIFSQIPDMRAYEDSLSSVSSPTKTVPNDLQKGKSKRKEIIEDIRQRLRDTSNNYYTFYQMKSFVIRKLNELKRLI